MSLTALSTGIGIIRPIPPFFGGIRNSKYVTQALPAVGVYVYLLYKWIFYIYVINSDNIDCTLWSSLVLILVNMLSRALLETRNRNWLAFYQILLG